MAINQVAISGNLVAKPDLRGTAGGNEVLNFTVAVNDRKKDTDTGNWEDYPNFIDCVSFGNRAAALSKLLDKGNKVAVSGKLRQSRWTKDGKANSRIQILADEVVILIEKTPKPAIMAEEGEQVPY